MPHASIDLSASNAQAAELLESIPGVRRIIAFPHKGPRLVSRYFGALRALRAQRYDLAIDPVPESTSGRIAISLCRARYRLGFATGSQWAPLTHAMAETGPAHQGVQPVLLLCRAFNVPCDLHGLQLSLCLRPEELEAGRQAVIAAVSRVTGARATPGRAFGFFAHATASKTIERTWWLAFWQAFLELEPEAVPLEFLPTPHTPPVDPRFARLHFPSTRALTAAMAATHAFISADTGPMHLASSTPVPTVALFQATDPAIYGPLKPIDVTLDLNRVTPQQVAQRCQELWRRSA